MNKQKILLPGGAGLVGQNLIAVKNFLEKIENSIKYVVSGLFFLTIVTHFAAINPWFPIPGHDPSWCFGLNQAVSQKLIFGKDVLFTFGPYASVYTKMSHPATDHLMLWGSVFLGVFYALALFLVFKGNKPRWFIACSLFIVGFVWYGDADLFAYPLVIALITYRATLPITDENKLLLSDSTRLIFGFLLACLGFLPLIKGSFLLITGAIAWLCCFLLWKNDEKILAVTSLCGPIVLGLSAWIIAGQPLSAIPDFLIGLAQIILGYSEAMASSIGRVGEIWLFIFAASSILYAIVSKIKTPPASKWFLFAAITCFLFISFKEGFVRHDGHAVIAVTSLLLGTFLIFAILRKSLPLYPVFLCALTWFVIDKHYNHPPATHVYNCIKEFYPATWRGIRSRLETPNALQEKFENALQNIYNECPLPKVDGSTDIYSCNQAYLLASGNKWFPRPVFQSYSVYTPFLAKLNADHLRKQGADHIFFKVEPIDGRLPALEDGLSWPLLVNAYSFTQIENGYAYLNRRSPDLIVQPIEKEIYNQKHQVGREAVLPESKEPLFAYLDISPSILGRVMGFLFKPPQIHISLTLPHGETRTYRLISGMAKAGFFLSPLFENTEDFVALASTDSSLLEKKKVKSVRVLIGRGWSIFWNTKYKLKLCTVELAKTR